MLYMYLAVPAVAVAAKGAAGGMGTMAGTGARFSFLALVLALFMLGYVAWVGDRLTARAPALAAAAPAVAALAVTGLAVTGPAVTGRPVPCQPLTRWRHQARS